GSSGARFSEVYGLVHDLLNLLFKGLKVAFGRTALIYEFGLEQEQRIALFRLIHFALGSVVPVRGISHGMSEEPVGGSLQKKWPLPGPDLIHSLAHRIAD